MAHIPIGTHKTAIATQVVEAEFTCASCGHRTPVLVRAAALGHAVNLLFLDGEGSRALASEAAQAGIGDAVKRHLGFVPCPECHAEGAGVAQARKDVRYHAAALGLLVFVIVGGLLTLILIGMAELSVPPAWGIPIGVGVGAVAGIWAALNALKSMVPRNIERALRAVTFGAASSAAEVESTEPPAPGKTCGACGLVSEAGAEFCSGCLGALA